VFEITKSILLTLLIAAAIAIISNQFLNQSFIGVLLLSITIQIVFAWFFRTYLQYTHQKNLATQQSLILSQLDAEATEAPCAYCGAINLIPVSPNQNNDFECIECGEPNSVYVNVTVAQKTVPIDADRYEVTNFNQNLHTAKTKILDE
jgi:hypothetical protein